MLKLRTRSARRRGRHGRPLAVGLVACAACALAACVGPFGDLLALVPSEEELAAFNERVAALPSVAVRIVNNTDVLASVKLEVSMPGLESEVLGAVGGVAGADILNQIDSRELLISAGGAATGSIKCGETIGISARAPFDASGFGFTSSGFGPFFEPGNIQFSGTGASDESFTGDIVSTVRLIRPAVDGIDCETATLVIQIDTPGVEEVVDPDTGAVVTPAAPGTGTVLVE
ncbi:MAG: hypothetical protein ACE5E6_04860 [Phycisphaerae bacterium]